MVAFTPPADRRSDHNWGTLLTGRSHHEPSSRFRRRLQTLVKATIHAQTEADQRLARMFGFNLLLFVTSAISGFSAQNMEQSVPRSLTSEGRIYFRVAGLELRRTLIGRSIEEIGCESTSGCRVSYESDGRSAKVQGDSVSIAGTYDIQTDRFCSAFGGTRVCKALFRSVDGSFVQLYLMNGQMVEVSLNPYPVGL